MNLKVPGSPAVKHHSKESFLERKLIDLVGHYKYLRHSSRLLVEPETESLHLLEPETAS
jgi:hypothetical protein